MATTPAAPRFDRRSFARLFAVGGSAALFGSASLAEALDAFRPTPLAPTPAAPDDAFWTNVRQQFLMPPELSVLNAANLCPSPASVLKAVYDNTQRLDRAPVPSFRTEMHEAREPVRKQLAAYLRVTPEEIIITRNTSEANNMVSNGLDLKTDDEVLLFEDNHPSNNLAWQEKAKRFGYKVITVPQTNPHPGPEYYLKAFRAGITTNTKVLAFTHLTSTVGDLFPAKELCALARERGVMTLIDGAQTFGLLDVDLGDIKPDFYTGSAHKWPCGPKEVGLLYVNARVQKKLWPTIYSAYPGQTGLSKTFEGMGQRDEPAIRAFGEGLTFLTTIGQKQIEAYSRELGRALIEGLSKVDGVKLWTSRDATRSAAVVSFQPGTLEPAAITAALERENIVCAPRAGADRPGIRLAPHFYNSHADVDRAVATIAKYVRSGV
jgi:selenocysteine lyase/cysteine desulfurase